jgi:hypothetical protein
MMYPKIKSVKCHLLTSNILQKGHILVDRFFHRFHFYFVFDFSKAYLISRWKTINLFLHILNKVMFVNSHIYKNYNH